MKRDGKLVENARLLCQKGFANVSLIILAFGLGRLVSPVS